MDNCDWTDRSAAAAGSSPGVQQQQLFWLQLRDTLRATSSPPQPSDPSHPCYPFNPCSKERGSAPCSTPRRDSGGSVGIGRNHGTGKESCTSTSVLCPFCPRFVRSVMSVDAGSLGGRRRRPRI